MKKLLSLTLFVILCAGSLQAEINFERKFYLGGWLTSGNTEGQSFHTDLYLSRDHKFINSLSLKGSLGQESSAGVETMFKIYSALRYAHSINKKLYNFYKLEAEHDRFQDIDLRLIPTLGIGYWFVDQKDFKAMLEGAVGYQRDYMVDRTRDEMVVLKLSSDLFLGGFSNELDIYVAASNSDNFRIVNQANYKIKLNTYYWFKWSLKDEYDNLPAAGVKKNDLRFTIGIEYSFKLRVD